MPEATSSPSADRVRVVASLEALRPAWARLADAAGNPFTTWDWASTWWKHFGRGRLCLVTLERSGTTRVILPLYLDRLGPIRVLRFIGGGAGDQLGPVCAPEDEADAGALLGLLAAEPRSPGHVLLAERLPGDRDWEASVGGTVLRRDASPVIDLAGGWPEVTGRFGRKLRKEIRRKERALSRHHRVRFRRTDDAATLDADLGMFIGLHRARWGDRSSLLPKAAFHREFAAQALARGWLELWILEVDERPVAARYDFLVGGRWFAYSAGRDPAWSRESVGLVLRAHTIRTAIERGATEYRLLRGDEAYKDRLATGDDGLVTIAVGRDAAGRAAVRGGEAALAARRVWRQVAARLGGGASR